MYGPIAGIMLASFYIQHKKRLEMSQIYVKPGDDGGYTGGYNRIAVIVLIISFLIPMSGVVFTNVPLLVTLKDFAFFSGLIISFVLYTLLYKQTNEKTQAAK
ncbi:putative allantoin permease [compost metagenome]